MRSLIDIADETERARAKHGRSFERSSDDAKLRILLEEVGKVAKALNDQQFGDENYSAAAPTMTTDALLSFREERAALRDHLRAEIVQVASLAIRWLNCIDGVDQ